jgi:hypothetical protein
LLLIGLMFLEGIWHKKGGIIKSLIDIDDIFFAKIKDKRILKAGDQVAFLVCAVMALSTLLNGLLFLLDPLIPNVSAIFIFIVVVLTWPVRIIFISYFKKRKYEEIPRIWPFAK